MKKEKLESCPAKNREQCKFGIESECNYDKKDCFLKKENENKKRCDKTQLKVIIFIACGVILFLISIILNNQVERSVQIEEQQSVVTMKDWATTLSSLSISLIAGAFLTYIIDIPSKLKEYETSFLNALSSNNYLKSLDESRLVQLRKDTTEQLHAKNAPFMAKGLIDIDQRICDLLKEPYYTKYRQSVICSDIKNDKNYIYKEHMIDYCLRNPYGKNKEAVEYVGFTNLILMKGGKIKDFISKIKIEYKIDDNERLKFSHKSYQIESSKLNNKVEFYDTKLVLCGIGNDSQLESRGIKVCFKQSLEIHIEYKIKVPKDDICFSKRLRHPAKNFRLDYTHTSSQIKLFGQVFGTELKQSDISIKYLADNIISLETFDWLLPDNGAIVVMTRKNKSNFLQKYCKCHSKCISLQ